MRLILYACVSSAAAAITSLKQISYNQYELAFTGGEPRLEDSDGAILPSSLSGSVITLNETGHWNNVQSASQLEGAIRTAFMGTFSSWYALYSAAGSDGNQRQQVPGSTVVNSPYALYTPRMTVNGDPGSGEAWNFDVGSGPSSSVVTIQANRVASVLTYVLMEGGIVVAAHKPSTYTCASASADPRFCAYSVTVPLPASFVDGTTIITACALISETESSCTTYPYAAPTPPAPPAAPPSPPRLPEPPSPPPAPKPPDQTPMGSAAIASTDLVAWIVIGSIAGAGVLLGAAFHAFKYFQESRQTWSA
jgi:hypothetical protein